MEQLTYDVTTLGTIVAALVGVAKGLGLPARFAPLAAIALAALFVYMPEGGRDELAATAAIGLAASGAYSFLKPDKQTPSWW